KELIENMAKESGLSRGNCEKALAAFQDTVINALKKDESVTLVGFGTFKVVARASRQGRNPSNGKALTIPARKVAKFVVGKTLKDIIK
ncbi:MAG: HU family DNA-binding protein, partial [Spirochaetota bacterium]